MMMMMRGLNKFLLVGRYLGVVANNELKWTPGIETVFQKLNRLVGICYKLCYQLPVYTIYFLHLCIRVFYTVQDNVRTNTESVQCHHVFDIAYLAPTLRDYVTS